MGIEALCKPSMQHVQCLSPDPFITPSTATPHFVGVGGKGVSVVAEQIGEQGAREHLLSTRALCLVLPLAAFARGRLARRPRHGTAPVWLALNARSARTHNDSCQHHTESSH